MFERIRKIDWLLPALVFLYFNAARILLRLLHFNEGTNLVIWFFVNLLLSIVCVLYLKHFDQLSVFRLGRPKLKLIGLTVLGFLLLYFWLSYVRDNFPVTHNQAGLNHNLTSVQGITRAFLVFSVSLGGPINEEIITRVFALNCWKRFKKYGMDILLAAAFFSSLHLYSWVWTDFLAYFGMGLVYVLLFRMSKTVYCSLALHIFLNTIIILVRLSH